MEVPAFVVEPSSGAPTAISQMCPGSPCGGFRRGPPALAGFMAEGLGFAIDSGVMAREGAVPISLSFPSEQAVSRAAAQVIRRNMFRMRSLGVLFLLVLSEPKVRQGRAHPHIGVGLPRSWGIQATECTPKP